MILLFESLICQHQVVNRFKGVLRFGDGKMGEDNLLDAVVVIEDAGKRLGWFKAFDLHIDPIFIALDDPIPGLDPDPLTGYLKPDEHIVENLKRTQMGLNITNQGNTHPTALTDPVQGQHFHNAMFHGYDFDNTMLRIGSMNMQLHGIQNPAILYRDSLAEDHAGDAEAYNLLLANPPFAGSLDYEGTAAKASTFTKGRYALTNIQYHPMSKLMAGAELQWFERDNLSDGYSYDSWRVQFSFRYRYSFWLGEDE